MNPRTLLPLALLLVAPACSEGPAATPAAGDLATVRLAATASVPGDYATVSEAVAAAAAGDTIAIGAGTFTLGGELVVDKALTFTGAGRGSTTLVGGVHATAALTMTDLRIDGDGADCVATSNDLDLERVDLVDCDTAVTASGSDAVILASVLASGARGAGVILYDVDAAAIENVIAAFNGGEGLVIDNLVAPSSVDIVNSLVFGNGFGGDSFCFDFPNLCGALRVDASDNVVIANTIISSNYYGLNCSDDCLNDYNIVWGNFVNYQRAATAGAHNKNLDPRLKKPTEGDFTLLFDSPAVDAGSTGLGATTDFAGKPRPIGDASDIGPHELGTPAAAVQVAITEVMANPLDEASGEYVELYNAGASAVDVAGWILDDGDATDALAGWNGGATTLPAGGYAVVLDPDYPGAVYSIPQDAVLLTVASTSTLGSGLSNSDPIRLLLDDGVTVVDSYSFPFDAGNGIAVEKENLEDGDLPGNWVPSPCGQSPGAENCAGQPVSTGTRILVGINEIMANPTDEATGEFIELLNSGSDPVDLAGFVISDGDASDTLAGWQGGSTVLAAGQYAVILDPDYAGGYTIPTGALLLTVASTTTLGNGLANTDPISLTTPNGLQVVDSYTHPFNAGDGRSVEKLDPGLIDLASNFLTSTCASGSSPGAPNCVTQDGTTPTTVADLFITEVMANALDEDTGEFVEIFNFGDAPVDLAGFRLSDGDKEEPLQAFSAGGNTVVPSLGYAVVLDAEYAGQYTIPGGAVLLRTPDTTIGSGLSTDDPITLRAPTGAAVLASFSFPFNPGNGVSAERVDLFVGDVPQNWVASPCNASPGADNCASETTTPSGAPVSTTSIVISEVMANPIDEATGEFIELFNAGPVGVDVAGWQLSDGDAFDTLVAWSTGTTVIGPGEIAVIFDPDYANDYVVGAGTVRLKVGNSTLGNGLTTTDTITLYEADGITVVDTFSFPANPGNGRSMEKVTLTAGDSADNWAAASCEAKTDTAKGPYYASAGRRNCVDPYGGISGTNTLGQTCPYGASDCLSGLCAIDLTTFGTFCTEDCSSAACPAGLTCTEISDINYAKVCVPEGGGAIPDVVINELRYDSEGSDTEVFIELEGAPGTILDGLTLVGINGADGKVYTTINLTGQIPSDGYFVVAHPSATGAVLANADQLTSKVDFQNGPDSVQLRQDNLILDALGYGDFGAAFFGGEGAAAADPEGDAGQSLQRSPDGGDSDNNAADFVAATPTPGAAN
ncbi:MAG: hypothetical protein EP329_12890 [Deltaproteobacteria bacterium]|nr:MAG: hypothetical protein EP329_12890 [Deltaproteobacteria bacterium]